MYLKLYFHCLTLNLLFSILKMLRNRYFHQKGSFFFSFELKNSASFTICTITDIQMIQILRLRKLAALVDVPENNTITAFEPFS